MTLHVILPQRDMPPSSGSAAHPSDETLAAYLEAVLSPAERAQMVAHLGDCDYCRSRLVLASRVLQAAPAPRRRKRFTPLAAGLLAAAGLAGVLLLSRSAVQPSRTDSPERAAEETSLPSLRPIGPALGTDVDRSDLRFVWAPISADVLYQVTLSAADGRVLWSNRTSDTVVTPPPATLRLLQPGRSYFWRVDALLADLRSVTSGDQRFEVSAP